jgi:hypothetical protein
VEEEDDRGMGAKMGWGVMGGNGGGHKVTGSA